MRALLSIATAVLISSAAAANEPEARRCAAMQNDTERLACYDLIYRVSRTEPARAGNWQVSSERSKIDDSTNALAVLESIEPIRGRYGGHVPVTLAFVCSENMTRAFITFGNHYMSSHSNGIVLYRIDDRPAQRRKMIESNDHRSMGFWTPRDAINFIKELSTGNRLFVQATPHLENAISAEFDLAGIEEAVKPVAAACGWADQATR